MPIILSAALSLTGLAIGLAAGTTLAAGALVAVRAAGARR